MFIFSQAVSLLQRVCRDRRGVTALEYAILAGLIVAAVVVAVGLFTPQIESAYSHLGSTVASATASAG